MKPKAKRIVTVIALLAALVFVLSGCIHMNISMKINDDGSVDWAYEMLMADEVTSMAPAGTDIWGETTLSAQNEGFTVEQVPSKDGYSGVKISRHFKNVEEMKGVQLLAGSESTAQGASDSFTATETKGFFATTYDIDLKLDSTNAMESASANMTGDATTDALLQGYLDQVQMNFMVTVPAKASSNNATSVSADGLTYTWKLELQKPNEMKLTASVLNMTNILLVGGGALLVIIIILVVVLLVVGASKKKKKAALAAAEQPPVPPAGPAV